MSKSHEEIVRSALDTAAQEGPAAADRLAERRRPTVADTESEYQKQRYARTAEGLSPLRADPFAADAVPSAALRTFKDVLSETQLEKERQTVLRQIQQQQEAKAKAEALAAAATAVGAAAPGAVPVPAGAALAPATGTARAKRSRWGTSVESSSTPSAAAAPAAMTDAEASTYVSTPVVAAKTWDGDAVPPAALLPPAASSSAASSVPSSSLPSSSSSSSSAAAAVAAIAAAAGAVVASAPSRSSRWDAAPTSSSSSGLFGAPTASSSAATAALGALAARRQQVAETHTRPWTAEAIAAQLPAEGYVILAPPPGYTPRPQPTEAETAAQTALARLTATPPPSAGADADDDSLQGLGQGLVGLSTGVTSAALAKELGVDMPPELDGVPFTKEDDVKHFGKLLERVDEGSLSVEESNERQILLLVLKVKNGSPPQRKTAQRQLMERARGYGPAALFGVLLPLLMSGELEPQERHRLVKVVDRVLLRLDDLVRPWVHKLLIVIQPMLLDEDHYARAEARELVANLAKAAGLAAMISTMRADLDCPDEYVRNATARAFAVVASTCGIAAVAPFLKAVARSTKSWEARHTGIKVVQQIAVLVGCSVLPHLTVLVDVVAAGLGDENTKVRCIAALALASLAEASYPYGIDAFDEVLPPLWQGVRTNRGRTLAAFLRAVGFVVPLMAPEHAAYYAKNAMEVVIREFASSDSEMKRVVVAVARQLVAAEGVEPEYVRTAVVPPFFEAFWNRRTALDPRSRRAVVLATTDLAAKAGGGVLVERIVDDLKDEAPQYRHMVVDAVEAILTRLGAADIDKRLEERLVDGLIHAFQLQITAAADEADGAGAGGSGNSVLSGFSAVLATLGPRARDYVPQVCGMVRHLLNNRFPRMRQQAAELLARVAPVMAQCGEEKELCRLGVVLFESLGEEYPDVLAAVLGGLKAVVTAVGTDAMTPPIGDLLPRLTPILKNRHERVQEQLIDLVGRIADSGPEHVSQKEWMRVSFDLLDMLRAPRKAIRKAATNTFGFIARAIGPHEVLVTLLNNLRVQDRTSRVSTSVAIAIVAEACQPFTVLPALMNEYRTPDLNVQNGVLKTLSFLFEYIGELGRDYVYAVAPLLEDALMDRDIVHRQTACTAVKHIAVGAVGLGREDVMLHLLNLVWPNIFETSPHVQSAVTEAIEGLRLALGPARLLQYLLAGLFHPARRVRTVYWRIYNAMYVACQDGMVAAYPRLPDDEHTNTRWELEMIL